MSLHFHFTNEVYPKSQTYICPTLFYGQAQQIKMIITIYSRYLIIFMGVVFHRYYDECGIMEQYLETNL